MTETQLRVQQLAEYDQLTPEQRNRLWNGGDVRGVPVRCDHCNAPAAWASPSGAYLSLACTFAGHIAWSQSTGSACPVSAITVADFPVVDPDTVVPPAPCGCPRYWENDGSLTTEHDRGDDPCTDPPAEIIEERRHVQLLTDARLKPVKQFAQYDGFFPGAGGTDSVIKPDEDGDCVMMGDVWELRNGTPVRVQIEPDVHAADAARVLRKIADWVEGNGDPVIVPPPPLPF